MSNKNEPLIVSVVIPLFNGKKYINSLYKMVMEAFKYADIEGKSEIIFVNDSPAQTINIDYYTNAHILVNDKNMGIHASKVRGLIKAKGKYIHFLDQDDKITREFYKEQINNILNSDISVCNAILEHETYKRKLYRSNISLWLVKQYWSYIIIDNRIESLGQCLIKRESIPHEWMENILMKNGADDFLLILLLFEHNASFNICPDAFYIHIHTGNNFSLNKEKMIISLIEVKNVMNKINKNGKISKELTKKMEFECENKISISYLPFFVIRILRDISVRLRG